ncbi:hypothetical protein [Glutamicibacter sp. V16R2B1]|nr:hypothetical protein [Glutamicibacter sp. V16R2B1]
MMPRLRRALDATADNALLVAAVALAVAVFAREGHRGLDGHA